MLQEAKKQLDLVSIEQIKEILKKNAKSEFDKMIINSETDIKRTDYYYSALNYKKAERRLYAITFPLFDSIKNDFSLFEGGVGKFGEKSIVEYEGYINEFSKMEGAKLHKIPLSDVDNAFEFPFDAENKEVNKTQRKYFLPKFTYQETCEKCNGNKYITCTNIECKGKHVWRCKECIGTGQITCSKCKGHGYTKCWTCSGIGKTTQGIGDDKKTVRCTKCMGKGEVPCSKCGVSGKVRCQTCDGDGEITCRYCYSDRERRGMIDCPVCLTAGTNGQFTFVETLIEDSNTHKLIKIGDDIELEEEIVFKHVKSDLNFMPIYKRINEKISDENDEISKKLTNMYEEELELSKTDFPMVLKEEIIYQVIPVVEISYKHMLTNEIHEFAIVDFWNNPEILFYSEAEKLKVGAGSILKIIVGLFSKMFKTKGYLKKEDRKTEIKLMIYLAKSDGKIEEQEKEYLSEQISHFKEFKNSEKKELFNLMNADELPELTSKDVKFSDPEKGKKIIDKLTQLAHSDGELEEAEKLLIEKIKTLMNDE